MTKSELQADTMRYLGSLDPALPRMVQVMLDTEYNQAMLDVLADMEAATATDAMTGRSAFKRVLALMDARFRK